MKKLFYLIAFMMLILCACEKEPMLTVSLNSITAPSNGNSTTIVVNANNPWNVSGNDWCTVSPSSGEGGQITVTVTVKENTTYDARSCTLTFASAGLTQSVSVSQESNYGVVLQKNMYEISSDTQQISVEVKANVDYDVTISADWIKQSGTKSLSSKTYLFDIEKNDTYDAREGIITIKEKNGSNTEVIKVKQAQKDAIIISSKEYAISSNAQELQIKLQTNVELEVVIPDNAKDWISHTATKALVDKTLVLNIKANEEYDARKCEVIVRMKSNRALADTIRIHQECKGVILLDQSVYYLSSIQQSFNVNFKTNLEVEIHIPLEDQKWLSYIKTKGLSDITICLKVEANENFDDRCGYIIVKDVRSVNEDTINIVQYGTLAYFENNEFKGYGAQIDGKIWAPVNCGYEADKEDYKGYPYGKMYQWGRKYGQGYNLYYDETAPYADNKVVPGPVELKESQDLKSEYNFYMSTSSSGDWLLFQNAALWNCGTEDYPVKAEYDPCPDGWRVPTMTELNSLIKNKSSWITEENQNGYWFSGSKNYSDAKENEKVFFPAAGRLGHNSGRPLSRGKYGLYWSSSPRIYDTYGTALYLRIYAGDVYEETFGGDRAYGQSVRCVKE